jgi:hypothetical protein
MIREFYKGEQGDLGSKALAHAKGEYPPAQQRIPQGVNTRFHSFEAKFSKAPPTKQPDCKDMARKPQLVPTAQHLCWRLSRAQSLAHNNPDLISLGLPKKQAAALRGPVRDCSARFSTYAHGLYLAYWIQTINALSHFSQF